LVIAVSISKYFRYDFCFGLENPGCIIRHILSSYLLLQRGIAPKVLRKKEIAKDDLGKGAYHRSLLSAGIGPEGQGCGATAEFGLANIIFFPLNYPLPVTKT